MSITPSRALATGIPGSAPAILCRRERSVPQKETQAGGRRPRRLLWPPRALAALPAGRRARIHRAEPEHRGREHGAHLRVAQGAVPEWVAARDASAEEIEEAIALGELLAHTKAPRIKKILEAISERTGEPDLSELEGMSDEEAQAYLVALPGVGPKTAACVLLFALERPVMPVDTHVHRVRRLGIIDQRVTAVGAPAAHRARSAPAA